MKAYIITEEQKTALLNELRLEYFKTPDQFAVTPEQKKAQLDALENVHRRFHYHVCKLLS